MSASDWTPERCARLKVLWTQGLSCSQIAKDLGGVTRNAVIGKRIRMHLPNRTAPNRTYGTRTKPKARAMLVPKAPRETFTTPSAGPPKLKADPFVSHPPRKHALSMRWEDHKDFKHCAMHCEGESGALGFVCGKPVKAGSVYCEACAGLVYQPAQVKARAA